MKISRDELFPKSLNLKSRVGGGAPPGFSVPIDIAALKSKYKGEHFFRGGRPPGIEDCEPIEIDVGLRF